MGARWPHEVAMSVLVHMRYLADDAFNDAQWATLAGPIAAALPSGLLPIGLAGGESAGSPAPRRAPDALAELIDAGLLEVGEQLVWDGHTATVRDGGVLHDGGPHEFAVSTVSTVTTLATSLAGYTVNGWHLWRRARDDRPLSELRTALATP
jgi:RAMA domain-containing protein